MIFKNRYALLTVDTEALPKRASKDHVNRLIWGKHDNGTAGVQELCAIGNDFNVKHVFFVDMCGAYFYPEELLDVVQWLDRDGQDVQLHTHPEILPQRFWTDKGFEIPPEGMNNYHRNAWAEHVVKYFSAMLSGMTGKKTLAYRAGSLRWNASLVRALQAANVPLSFNNSMRAFQGRRCVFSEPTNLPYVWSNGVIEVPLTEKSVYMGVGKEESWASLTFPLSSYFQFGQSNSSFFSAIFGRLPNFCVFLMHSWSLLTWDENGYATYKDDRRLEDYRKLLARLTKDYDVITTIDFLDLHARGKIPITHMVDLSLAELQR